MQPAKARPADRNYCLITPCRNEAQYAARTIESVARQSVPPALWIIVDDGSTDETPRILANYSRRLPYLRVVSRADRGFRRVGGGVIDAFNEGLSAIHRPDFDFLCKLDLDLDLPPRYFERLMERMADDPQLGTCSGKPFFHAGGREHDEVCGDENSVGMTKFYRRTWFEEIGGFVSEVMWDGIDCHRCRMLGWKAASYSDAELRFEHLRPMGSSQTSIWHGRKRHGEGQYFMGTRPVFLAASALYRLGSPPRVIGSLAMMWGYMSAAVRRAPRYADNEFVEFLRRYQWRSLVVGKKRAVDEIDASNEARLLSRQGQAEPAWDEAAEVGGWPPSEAAHDLQGPHRPAAASASQVPAVAQGREE